MSKKWASNKKDQLLVENFKNFMKEGDFSSDLNEVERYQPQRDAASTVAKTAAVGAAGTLGAAAGATIGLLIPPAMPALAAAGGTLGTAVGTLASNAIAGMIDGIADEKVLAPLQRVELSEETFMETVSRIHDEALREVEKQESESGNDKLKTVDNDSVVEGVAQWLEGKLDSADLSPEHLEIIRFDARELRDAAKEKNIDPKLEKMVVDILRQKDLVIEDTLGRRLGKTVDKFNVASRAGEYAGPKLSKAANYFLDKMK